MKRVILLISTILLLCIDSIYAQDYWEDLSGNGNPISLRAGEDWNVSARINAGDNSVKINGFGLLRSQKVREDGKKGVIISDKLKECLSKLDNRGEEDFTCSAHFTKGVSNYVFNYNGLGLSIKGKTEDGIGSLFSKGQITPKTQLGLYYIFKSVKIENNLHQYTWVFSPFVNVNFASYQLVPSDSAYAFDKTEANITGFNAGISLFRQGYIRANQIVLGGSYTFSRKNNYNDLDQVELKEYYIKNDTLGGQTQISKVNDNGYVYGVGTIKEYNNSNLKIYASYLPEYFKYRVAFILYPSVDINDLYDNPLFNLGFGVHFMQKGNPGLSVAGVNFEFTDINNAKEKTDPFLKRSFKISISTALNVISLVRKD
jgi:hypothetical protein